MISSFSNYFFFLFYIYVRFVLFNLSRLQSNKKFESSIHKKSKMLCMVSFQSYLIFSSGMKIELCSLLNSKCFKIQKSSRNLYVFTIGCSLLIFAHVFLFLGLVCSLIPSCGHFFLAANNRARKPKAPIMMVSPSLSASAVFDNIVSNILL